MTIFDRFTSTVWVLSYRMEEARQRYASRRQLVKQAGACLALALMRQAGGVAPIPHPGTRTPSTLESIAASLATIAENSGAVVTHLDAIGNDVDRVAFHVEEFWNCIPADILDTVSKGRT